MYLGKEVYIARFPQWMRHIYPEVPITRGYTTNIKSLQWPLQFPIDMYSGITYAATNTKIRVWSGGYSYAGLVINMDADADTYWNFFVYSIAIGH